MVWDRSSICLVDPLLSNCANTTVTQTLYLRPAARRGILTAALSNHMYTAYSAMGCAEDLSLLRFVLPLTYTQYGAKATPSESIRSEGGTIKYYGTATNHFSIAEASRGLNTDSVAHMVKFFLSFFSTLFFLKDKLLGKEASRRKPNFPSIK